jgi:hypothetical protein
MGQAVASAPRWTKPMANLFPATTMMYSILYRVSRTLPNIPTSYYHFYDCSFTLLHVQDNVLPFSAETNFTNPLQAIGIGIGLGIC